MQVATHVTKFYVNHGLKADRISQTFIRYQLQEVDVMKARARTAATLSMQVQEYFAAVDHLRETQCSARLLFENLRICLGDPAEENLRRMEGSEDDGDSWAQSKNNKACLSDAQLALVVKHVLLEANLPYGEGADDPVSMTDIIDLNTDHTCDLVSMLELYRHEKGDEEMLERIMKASPQPWPRPSP